MSAFNATDVDKALQLLWRDRSSPIELRILKPKSTHSGYFDDAAALIKTAESWDTRGNVYVTLNKVHPDCASRRLNWVDLAKSGETTKDNEVIRRQNIYVDIDPVRMGGIPSTDEEHEAARELAIEVRSFLDEHGLPETALFSSGNGFGLFMAVDLPTDDGKIVKRFLQALAIQFDDERVKVDRSVHNPGRIARLPGTLNCKGEHSAHRPHRRAEIIAAPESLIPATELQLQAVIDAVQGKIIQSSPLRSNKSNVSTELARFDVASWLTTRSISFQVAEKEGGTQFKLDQCPFKSEGHPAGGCAIFQGVDGSVSASCFHAKCTWGWKELRHKLDPNFDANAELGAVSGSESIKDPHRLARLLLADFSHVERSTILRHKRLFYSWRDGVWTERPQDEVRALITKRVKAEFDRYAQAMALSGAPCQTPQVTTRLVGDVLNAFGSIIDIELSDGGCWLDGDGWATDEILVCRSAIVHLPSYLEGSTSYSMPHTPRLFVHNKLEFDFDPNAAAPERWLQLLQEIWPGDGDSRRLLQEFFGYCLTPDASMQKFLALIGASRGGKGTITGVLSALVGKPNVCSVRLGKLASRFGLENAVDKSLILVPDATMPRPDRAAEVVEILKAITGGDAIDVDRKGKPVITATLNGKIVVSSNNMIGLPDDSAALYHRMLALRFSQSFIGREDTLLQAKLRSELSGILKWAVDGYRLLRATKSFTVAKSGDLLKRQLTMKGSPVASFVEEHCSVGPKLKVEHSVLYGLFKTFCDEFGVEACDAADFGRKLLEAVPSINPDHRPSAKESRGKRPRYYQGMGLKSDIPAVVGQSQSETDSVLTITVPADTGTGNTVTTSLRPCDEELTLAV